MQYLVIAYDNDNALERRLESREAHIEGARKLMAEGKIINAGALIEDDNGWFNTICWFWFRWRIDEWLQMNLMFKKIMFGIWMNSKSCQWNCFPNTAINLK